MSNPTIQLELAAALRLLHLMQPYAPPAERRQIAAMMAERINGFIPPAKAQSADAVAAAAQLYGEGMVRIGQLLKPDQVTAIVDYFIDRPCFNGHVLPFSDGVARKIGAGADEHHFGVYPLADIVGAPYLLELANHSQLLGIAEKYLGCTPTLYSLNAWWSFSGHGQAPMTQKFHRDHDDYNFCTLFVYLTDVGAENGPHLYIRRTHRYDLTLAMLKQAPPGSPRIETLYGFDPPDHPMSDVFPGLVETITGPAGSAFVADTSGFHMGVPLTAGRRLMFWARYGIYRNAANFDDGTVPIERALVGRRLRGDQRTAYINRCIIAPPT